MPKRSQPGAPVVKENYSLGSCSPARERRDVERTNVPALTRRATPDVSPVRLHGGREIERTNIPALPLRAAADTSPIGLHDGGATTWVSGRLGFCTLFSA